VGSVSSVRNNISRRHEGHGVLISKAGKILGLFYAKSVEVAKCFFWDTDWTDLHG